MKYAQYQELKRPYKPLSRAKMAGLRLELIRPEPTGITSQDKSGTFPIGVTNQLNFKSKLSTKAPFC